MLESTTQQPKILRKMVYRFAFLSLLLAGIVFGYLKFREWSQDIDMPETYDTAGMISAIQLHDEGSQAVIFQADGSMLESPGYEPGKTDKDAVWRPDGNRLFFVSDREENAVNVFRWNIGGKKIARRSYNSRAKGTPQWLPADAENANKLALITSGPFVLEFNPTNGDTRQVLPPVSKERSASDPEGGSAGQFETIYGQIGDSFKLAKWTPDKKFVVAVMRDERGEVLVAQDLSTDKLPVPIAAGDRIEFDINPRTGMVVFTVLEYRLFDPTQAPPEMVQKDGSIKLPFRHMIGTIDLAAPPETAQAPIARSNSDDAFLAPSISPDGQYLLIVACKVKSRANYAPEGLIVLPATPTDVPSGTPILRGEVYEPSWHPNSNAVAFIQYDEQKKRSIWTVGRDGTNLKNVSAGKGDFANPRFSPQSK